MSTVTAARIASYRRTGADVGIALHSYVDRLHYIPQPNPARHTQLATCGRQVIPVDDPTGYTPCRQCWPTGHLERDMHDIWDLCDDLDGRYNGSIRTLDDRPLGSILEWPRPPRAS